MKVILYDFSFRQHLPGKSGLSSVVWEYVPRLAKLDVEVHVVGPYRSVLPDPVEGVTTHAHPFPSGGKSNVLMHAVTIHAGWRYIRQHLPDADLIHSFEYLSSAILGRLTNIPTVLTVPGNIFERRASGYNPFDPITTRAYQLAALSTVRTISHIIAISENERSWWISFGMDEARITTLPYGVDIGYFKPVADADTQVGWTPDIKHVLFVGRLSHEKGVLLLLQAFERLVDNHPDTHLHIIGDGPDSDRINAFLADHASLVGRVTLHGWVVKSDLPTYYAAAHLLMVPSLTEPLGRVVMEGLASGTPVIGAQVGGIPDLIQDGETGFLFTKGDVDALTNCLRDALENPQRVAEMSNRAVQYARDYLSLEYIAEQTVQQVYNTVVTERTKQSE